MRKNNQYYIRKAHRYLGVIIGIQFIFWTTSGLYFSWTNIDSIHGDHFLKEVKDRSATNLVGLNQIDSTLEVKTMELRFINATPHYWINENRLVNALTGEFREDVTKEEALSIVRENIKDEYEIASTELIKEAGSHNEYRENLLPAWVVRFNGSNGLAAYVSASDGRFQKVRHRDWRIFDFLYMTHMMDYQGRDNFNNLLLRIFSAFGLITVASGFTLFFVSRKKKGRKKRTSS